MEILSQKLSEILTLDSQSSILTQEQILVQSPGMSTWLKIEIAKHNGIAAGYEFPLPSSFIWTLCYLLLPDVPKENPYTKPAMTWKLMSLLPKIIDDETYSPLKHYLGQDIDLKLFQLSSRIADIYDQYLVYRPDWILGWENQQQPLELTKEHEWQPKLWQALTQYNNETLQQSHYHRANLHQSLIARLQDPTESLTKLPSKLFIFGISSMAPQTLDVIYQLANRIDVFMFSLSPCQHYWGDIIDPKTRSRLANAYENKKQLPELWQESLEVGNPLLANNGKMGREMLDMVLELSPTHVSFHELFQSTGDSNLLNGIQTDILEMETLGKSLSPELEQYLNIKQRRILNKNDDSITLRSCHSALRELETLHDHLLHKFKLNPNLEPKDCVVMMPDVASYAPFIDAVFSSKQGDYYIPYAIADRGAAQESPLINSFINLLALDKSRYGVTEIISILEVPSIMKRFDLDDDELRLLKNWIKQAQIRWGRNAQSRLDSGIAYFDSNSWAFGIRRMLLGYALGDDAAIYQNDLPVSGIDGQSAQSLGKLLNFVETIDQCKTSLMESSSPTSKIASLVGLVDSMFDNNENDNDEIQLIRQSIEKFSTEINTAGFGSNLPLKVIQEWFRKALTESRVGQRYLAGNVNFCTLMPMRSIPFKLVCLLGMNDGVYPRIQHPVGFDLMAHFGNKRGDRSRRSDDRYLFLEALLSAREQFYISYIGHSERDNSERIPSMLVSELIEYCQLCYRPQSDQYQIEIQKNLDNNQLALLGNQAAREVKNQLVMQMPLQPFDPSLYQHNTTRQSFANNWCPPAETCDDINTVKPFIALNENIQLENESGLTEQLLPNKELLELSSLIRFYRNPAKYFFQRTLKVNLNIELEDQDNDEPFALSALNRHQIQQQLILSALDDPMGEVNPAVIDEIKASGELPMAPFDDITLSKYTNDIASVVERAQYLMTDKAPISCDIALSFMLNKEIILQGKIDQIYSKGLIIVRPGTAKARDLLSLYIRHLCLNANQHHRSSYLLDAGHFYCLAAIESYQAYDLLQSLLQHFYQGLSHPLFFIPETSLAYYQAEGDHQQRLIEAEKKWHHDSGFGDGNDPHNERLYRFPDDFSENIFGRHAIGLLTPMVSLLDKKPLKELQGFIENPNNKHSSNNLGEH